MVPVPAATETYLGNSNKYTIITLSYEYIAIALESYITLSSKNFTLCNKMDAMYYCENLHQLHLRSDHKCASAILLMVNLVNSVMVDIVYLAKI